MSELSRRTFLGTAGVALFASGRWTLRADAQETPDSGSVGSYGDYLAQRGEGIDTPPARAADWAATEDNILGPFHRPNAPFRAKITPPLAAGDVLVIRGRVFGLDTREPLADAVLDIWQADHHGRYDNDDPGRPPGDDVFTNRARVITDASGMYEYETIHPGAYRLTESQWRPPHVHYLVRARGYRRLVTQLYFRGDPHQERDPFIKPSLIIDLERVETPRGAYRRGTFDIVLPPV